MAGAAMAVVAYQSALALILAFGAPYHHTIAIASERHDLPHGMLARLLHVESRYQVDAVSEAGAVGIAQIIPEHHPGVDPTDPHASIRYAASYLRRLHDRFGSWDLALAAYNWGPTNVADRIEAGRPLPSSVRSYVARILDDP